MFLVSLKPIDTRLDLGFEIYNEVTVYIACVMNIAFLDMTSTEISTDLRYLIGWALVAVIMLNVIINWTSLIIRTILFIVQ